VPDRVGDRRQERDLVRLGVPAAGVEVEALLNLRDLLAKLARQGRKHLELRGREQRAEPEPAAAG
jgi:hypothetical protein